MKPTLVKGDCFEYRHDDTDVIVLDPPFELYSPNWITFLQQILPEAYHYVVFSKFPYTGIVQTEFRLAPLVAEYVWHYTDMCTYRAKHMPLIHHETISIFSADTDRIDLDRIRRPHNVRLPPKFTTRKSRGKEGKPLHWEQDERGGWPSSVISVQRSLKGDTLKNPVPTGAKPVELFEKLLPAFPGHIFDPFMGSGSVGVYAGKNKIPYTGYEISDVYFETAKATGQASGTKLPELLAMYDRESSSWKTSQRCLLDGWTSFSETWPRSGMTVSGIAYLLPPLALRTDVIGSGLLPTPTAQDYGSNSGGRNPGHERPSLQTMARRNQWPTPKSSPSGPDYARVNRPRSGGDDLATAVARTIPTPTAGDAKSSGSRNTENSKANPGLSLTDFVRQDGGEGRQVATPDANCWKGGDRKAKITDPSYGILPDGGQLNPDWVSALMGFPIGWCDIRDEE